MNIKEFKKDRDEALLSLNKDTLDLFFKKYGIKMSSEPEVYWRAVHKAITSCLSLDIEFRRKSKQWLNEHNSESWDDGDL